MPEPRHRAIRCQQISVHRLFLHSFQHSRANARTARMTEIFRGDRFEACPRMLSAGGLSPTAFLRWRELPGHTLLLPQGLGRFRNGISSRRDRYRRAAPRQGRGAIPWSTISILNCNSMVQPKERRLITRISRAVMIQPTGTASRPATRPRSPVSEIISRRTWPGRKTHGPQQGVFLAAFQL